MKSFINQEEYLYYKGFQNNEFLRRGLDKLAQKVFGGLTFETWYEGGYWNEKFVPYTLFKDDEAVANILVVHFDIRFQEIDRHYIQLSTVMVDKNYRGRGLLRFLMKKFLEDYKEKCDGMYLYANDSVLEFYPKFGFKKELEYEYSKEIKSGTGKVIKLSLNNRENMELLVKMCKEGNPYSDIDMKDSHEIILFHCIKEFQDNIYYLPEDKVIVIAKQERDKLICYDIYGNPHLSIEYILSHIIKTGCNKIVLGFTPREKQKYTISLCEEINTTLFVLSNKENIFEHQQIMLPIICHA